MSAREIVLKWMPQNTVDDKPSTVQLIACYRQASRHYMSQCRPAIYMLPYGVTGPRWIWTSFGVVASQVRKCIWKCLVVTYLLRKNDVAASFLCKDFVYGTLIHTGGTDYSKQTIPISWLLITCECKIRTQEAKASAAMMILMGISTFFVIWHRGASRVVARI